MSKELAIASPKGYALASAWAQHSAVDGIQQTLDAITGGGIEVTPSFARVNIELTREQAADTIAFLANASEKESAVRTTLALVTGDILLQIEKQFGHAAAEEIITQVVSEYGQSKHTIQDWKRTVEFIEGLYGDNPEQRPSNLLITHWIEIKNGFRNNRGEQIIPHEKIYDLIETVSRGRLVNAGVDANGEPFEHYIPLSCAQTRALLKEARGEERAQPTPTAPPPAPEPARATESPPTPRYRRYVYINIDNCDNPAVSDSFIREYADNPDYIVYDLEQGECLGPYEDPGGFKIRGKIIDLDEEEEE